jgi:nucleoredoxin
MGIAHIPMKLLPADLQKALNYDPRAASQLPVMLDGKLISADGTKTDTPGPAVQYYAVYYSAQWCPPCHAFTPKLVQWYNKFKPAHPNFELIFVSEDHNEGSMLDYMKEMAMPWPAVRFNELQHAGNGTFKGSQIEKFANTEIPDLVLVEASGKVLSDSFQGDQYLGPEAVVEDINKIVGGTSPVPLASQP